MGDRNPFSDRNGPDRSNRKNQDPAVYVDEYNVHNILKDAISELVQHKPQRPYAFLRDYFGRLEALSNTRSNSIDSNGSAASKYLYY